MLTAMKIMDDKKFKRAAMVKNGQLIGMLTEEAPKKHHCKRNLIPNNSYVMIFLTSKKIELFYNYPNQGGHIMLKTCIANPRTNVTVQIMKVGIISLHIFEHPSSLNGWVIHEKMIMSPSTIATIPKMACNQTRDNWKSDKLLINIKSPMKTGIIIQSVVARFNPIAAMLKKPCIIRFLFWVLIL